MLSMGNAVFWCMPAPRPLDRFSQKLAQLITSWTTPHTQELGAIDLQGACLCMREIVTLRRVFFYGLMRLATGRPVGPIVVVNGSYDVLVTITSFLWFH